VLTKIKMRKINNTRIFVNELETQDENVSIFALLCVWTKSLMCKDAANRDSTFQSEEIQVPYQPSG
jgi:hypothetical protein